MRSSHIVSALAALALTTGCSTRPEPPALSIAGVTPSEGERGQDVAVAVTGLGFHVLIESDLDDGTPDLPGIEVTVGGTPLAQAVLIDESRIEGVVPGTLAIGAHDVVVTTAQGDSATLPAGFTVYERCDGDGDCDDGDPCTTSEACVDGNCAPGAADKDTDMDGYVDGACGGDDCDDDDELEFPGQTWYPDGDMDGDGDATATGTTCERAGPNDVANANDCDDGDDTVYSGTSCDDSDTCTELDTCALGVCSGIDTCSMDCEPTCAGGCGPDACCSEDCPGGDCPNCESDCSCDQTCSGTTDCSTTCTSDASCRLTANSTDNAQLTCASRSTCTLDCNDVAGECKLNCASDALCLMDCGDADSCNLGCSSGTTVDCGGGIYVCHRACP